MTISTLGETLTLYLAVSYEAISSVLMAEKENMQKRIYFVSKALQGPEVNYPPLEKLALALPKNSGRLAKRAIELGEHDIIYKLRLAIEGTNKKMPVWMLYTNGASSSKGSGPGLILTDLDGKEITYALRFKFPASNNC
ncbi:reverse transcriptase domain-containing protein [Tanacetum coccineum]